MVLGAIATHAPTTRHRVALVLLALALSGVAQAAPAATPFSIVESDLPLDGYAAVSRDGRVLAVGTTCDAAGCDASLAAHEPGGAILHAGVVSGRPVAFAPLRDGTALLVTTSPQHRGLSAADVTIAGKVVRSTAITRRFTRDVLAASNHDGAAAVAWLTTRLPQQLRVRVRRRDGAAFGPARTIASFAREGDFGGADVAVAPRGEVAVAWASGGSLVARVQDPRARRFGPLLRVGRSDRLARVAAAFTTGGRLVTIWSSADGGEEQNRPAVVRVALRRAGAMKFARSHKLGVGAAREPLALARGTAVRAVGAGSTAMVVWTSGTLRTRIASVTAEGTVTGARTIDPDGVLVDAVGSTSRRVLVAWTHDPLGAGAGAQAVIAPPGGRFGPGAPVGPAGSWATGAALDRAGTRALVTWGAGDPVLSPRWGLAERRLP